MSEEPLLAAWLCAGHYFFATRDRCEVTACQRPARFTKNVIAQFGLRDRKLWSLSKDKKRPELTPVSF